MTDLAALFAALALTSALALRRPVVTPHALAALACAVLYLARVMGGPRVAVAVFAAWPGVAVWLWWRARKDAAPGSLFARASGATGAVAEDAASARSRTLATPARLAQALWLAYALAIAYGGHHLRAVWPWPILIPNALPLLVAVAWWRRPRTWTERAAYVLPASCAADLVTVWCGAPPVVRETIGVATWGVYAWATWKASTPRGVAA